MKVTEVLGRTDYRLISELIPNGAKVLDLGCGDGALLEWLKVHKQVEARGVELKRELVQRAIARGVTVYQGNLEESLKDYPDKAFDYVILSQTLQETLQPLMVLQEMLRIGKHAIVAFPNFGHWRVRLSHLFSGRAPKTHLFPFDWYDSPNVHFLTVIDFEDLIRKQGWHVERRYFAAGHWAGEMAPNLFAEIAVYLFRPEP
ncbi:methionine biosynthesis protein MetW [Paludibaculum fermentans]|uniref:methionine biosynthesis protein MetW n=1 Tax=Paludibaculum fermentans TaxID=1473598 RepID=UPI001E367BD1|nr:methionine biosynthesis protein MetW [Paludibaculum fermentans]